MNNLNEAFASSIIKMLWSQQNGKKFLLSLTKHFRTLDINRITDDMLIVVDPKKGYSMRNKAYWKFWMNGDTIEGITNSNGCFDSYFETRISRRMSIAFCTPAFVDLWCVQGTWKAPWINKCIILDIDKILEKARQGITNAKREKARQGATALMTDMEIKKANIARYIKMLKDSRFSDGSEFGLIDNANKILISHAQQLTPAFLFISIVDDTFFNTYIQKYSNKLVEYIEELQKSGFSLKGENVISVDDYGFEIQANDLRKELIKIIDDVKQYKFIDNKITASNVKKAIDAIITDSIEFQKIIPFLSSSKRYDAEKLDTTIDFIKFINVEFASALSNPNISNDIYTFNEFIAQLNSITTQLRNDNAAREIRKFIYDVIYYINKPSMSDVKEIPFRLNVVKPTLLKRVEQMIKIIKNL